MYLGRSDHGMALGCRHCTGANDSNYVNTAYKFNYFDCSPLLANNFVKSRNNSNCCSVVKAVAMVAKTEETVTCVSRISEA